MTSGIMSYLTRHRTAANLLMLIVLAAGFAAYPNMRAQFFPDVIVDNVTVSVQWSGAGAEDVDNAIVQVLQPALLAVEGVSNTTSRSSEGSARIQMEFEPGWDMAKAAEDVQLAVDATSDLPAEPKTQACVVGNGQTALLTSSSQGRSILGNSGGLPMNLSSGFLRKV